MPSTPTTYSSKTPRPNRTKKSDSTVPPSSTMRKSRRRRKAINTPAASSTTTSENKDCIQQNQIKDIDDYSYSLNQNENLDRPPSSSSIASRSSTQSRQKTNQSMEQNDEDDSFEKENKINHSNKNTLIKTASIHNNRNRSHTIIAAATTNDESSIHIINSVHKSFLDDIQLCRHEWNNGTSNFFKSIKNVDISTKISTKTIIKGSIITFPNRLLHYKRNRVNGDTDVQSTMPTASADEIHQVYDIINTTRKYIRCIAMICKHYKKSKKKTFSHDELDISLALLRITNHCLKHAIPIIPSIKNQKSRKEHIKVTKILIKMIYYVMTSLEDMSMMHVGGGDSQQGWRINETNENILVMISLLMVSSFQMLGLLLQFLSSNPNEYENDHDNAIQDTNHLEHWFPMPIQYADCSGENDDDEELSNEDLTKVTIQCIIAMSIVLWNIHIAVVQHNLYHDEIESSSSSSFKRNFEQNFGLIHCSMIEEIKKKSIRQGKHESVDENNTFDIPFRSLLCSKALPWIKSLLLQGSNDQVQTCLSFLSRIKNLLLDGASQLEQIFQDFNMDNNDMEQQNELCAINNAKWLLNQGFILQQDSIMVQLLCERDVSNDWKSYVSMVKNNHIDLVAFDIEKRFEKACMCASNYSIRFDNRMKRLETSPFELGNFHQLVGARLDECACHFNEVFICYIQYCADRASHLQKKSFVRDTDIQHDDKCIFSHFQYQYGHGQEACCSAALQSPYSGFEALLALVYTVITVKNSLSCNEQIECSSIDKSIDYFKKEVLDSPRIDGFLSTCHSILSRLQLNSLAISLLKQIKEGKLCVDEMHSLILLGRIIGECYAPLTLLIAKQSVNAQNRARFLQTSVETYFRAAGLLDAAACLCIDHDENLLMDCYSMANTFISKCGLLACKMKEKCELAYTESVAKALHNLAKQRLDNKVRLSSLPCNDSDSCKRLSDKWTKQFKSMSILPFVVSIDIFTHIYAIKPELQFQVSSRILTLASLLSSIDMRKEACLALCYSVRYIVSEMDESKALKYINYSDILLFSDPYFTGKIKRSLIKHDQLTAVLQKIVRIYISLMMNEQDVQQEERFYDGLKIAQKSVFGSKLLKGLEWSPHSLLSNVMIELLSNSCENVVVVNEVLYMLGMAMSRQNEDIILSFQNDVTNSIDIIVKKMNILPAENVSAFYLSVATLCHSLNSKCEVVLQYLTKACTVIESCMQADSIDIIRKVTLITCKVSLLLLIDKMTVEIGAPKCNIQEEIVNHSSTVIDLLYIEDRTTTCSLPKLVTNSLVYSLVILYQKLHEGDEILLGDEKIISLISHIAKVNDNYTGFEAIAGPILVESEQYDRALILIDEVICKGNDDFYDKIRSLCDCISNQGSETLIALMLSQSFELCSATTPKQSLHGLEQCCAYVSSTILSNCKTQNIKRKDFALNLATLWWMSCCEWALSKGYSMRGEVDKAIICIRRCIKFCKNAIRIASTSTLQSQQLYEVNSESFGILFISLTALRTFFLSKLSESFESLAKCHCLLGDHKTAKMYIIAAGENAGLIPKRSAISNHMRVQDVIEMINPKMNKVRHLGLKTTLVDIFTQVELSAEVSSYLKSAFIEETVTFSPKKEYCSKDIAWFRESINTFILLNERLKEDNEYSTFFQTGISLVNEFCTIQPISHFLGTNSNSRGNICLTSDFQFKTDKYKWGSFHDTLSKVCLLISKNILDMDDRSESGNTSLLILLEEIISHDVISRECRAKASYLIGQYHLKIARKNGDLYSLWDGHSVFVSSNKESTHHLDRSKSNISSPSLHLSKHYFQQTASLASPISYLLCRQALRCLALSIGPDSQSEFGTAGEMIHSSIGSSARQKISRMYTDEDEHNRQDIDSIFGAYDTNLFDKRTREENLKVMYDLGGKLVPVNWRFVALTICPTGELLISLLYLNKKRNGSTRPCYRTACIFPQNEAMGVIDAVLQPFDSLMEQSKKQLNGIDVDSYDKYNGDRESKLEWWAKREEIDRALNTLLEYTQKQYFSADFIQDLFLQNNTINDPLNRNDDKVDSFCGGNLAARFEAAVTLNASQEENEQESKESLEKMTVKQIRNRLQELNIEGRQFNSLRKAGLVGLLHEKLEEKRKLQIQFAKDSMEASDYDMNDNLSNKKGNECLFLVLDEHLCRLPFEGMPFLKGRTICRIPSFPFAISSLQRLDESNGNSQGTVNPAQTRFVLDPESNLLGTQQRLHQVLNDVMKSNGLEWDGMIGKTPSMEFMHSTLTQKNGLFLYFGHNGGETFFPRGEIDSLMNGQHDGQQRECKSSLLLMGCSSGALVSVNQRNDDDSASKEDIFFEPEGVALSYICAGAPCVVGNLWDVTDRDIDRFSIALIKRLFHPQISNECDSMSIAHIVASTRDVCKMKNIVGCAPVVYGIPVSMINNNGDE